MSTEDEDGGANGDRNEVKPWIRKIRVQGYRTFGPEGVELELGPVTMLVGPNGSGKTNFGRLLSWIEQYCRHVAESRTWSLAYYLKEDSLILPKLFAPGAESAFETRFEVDCITQSPEWGILPLLKPALSSDGYLKVLIRADRLAGYLTISPLRAGDELPMFTIREGRAYLDDSHSLDDDAELDRALGSEKSQENNLRIRDLGLNICRSVAGRILLIEAARKVGRQKGTSSGGGRVRDGSEVVNDILQMAKDDPNSWGDTQRWMSDQLHALLGLPNADLRAEGQVRLAIRYGSRTHMADFQELSSGTQQLIMVLWEVYNGTRGRMLAFLDEPEASLHPAACARLVETVRKERPEIQLVLASQSSDLIDRVVPASACLRFERGFDDGLSVVSSMSSIAEKYRLLDCLGVRMSSVMLPEVIVFVEGPSDVVYYGAMVRAFCATLALGRDYGFAMFGGSLIAHLGIDDEEKLVDLSELCLRGCILVDKDREDGRPLKRSVQALKDRVNHPSQGLKDHFGFYETPKEAKEVEDLFEFEHVWAAARAALPSCHLPARPPARKGSALARIVAAMAGRQRAKQTVNRAKLTIAEHVISQGKIMDLLKKESVDWFRMGPAAFLLKALKR